MKDRLESEDDYQKAMDQMHALWDAQPDTMEYDELVKVVELIEDYEERNPIELPDHPCNSEGTCPVCFPPQ